MIRRRIIPRGMQRRQQRLEKVASRPVEASATAVAMRTSYSTAGCSVRIGYPSSQPLLLAVRPSSSPQQQRSGSSSMYERSEAVSIASAPAAKAPPPAAVYSNSRENTPFYTTNKGGVAWRSAVIVADSRRSFGTGSIAVGGQWHRSILTRAGGGRGPVGGGGGDSAGASFGPGQSSALRQRAMATLSEGEFHDVADDALEGINDAVERSLEDGFDGDFDCNMSVREGCDTVHRAQYAFKWDGTQFKVLYLCLKQGTNKSSRGVQCCTLQQIKAGLSDETRANS